MNFEAFHVVTERPMEKGQRIIFDENHHSGVYERVMSKLETVDEIYANPKKYRAQELEHHVSVALRELALEEVRVKEFPCYPSRLSCLYVSKTLEEAKDWLDYFVSLKRPVFGIARLSIDGRFFLGDAEKCFRGKTNKEENLRLARLYWSCPKEEIETPEMLIDGIITVEEIIKEDI